MPTPFDVVGVGLNATDTVLVVPKFPAYGGKAPFTREFYSVGDRLPQPWSPALAWDSHEIHRHHRRRRARPHPARQPPRVPALTSTTCSSASNCPNQSAYIVVDESTGERIFLDRPNALRSHLKPSQMSKSPALAVSHRRP